MDLFNKINQFNTMTPELLEKVNQFRNDPNMAKIRAEFIVLENKPVATQIQEASTENSECIDGECSEELKRVRVESENESENKKFKIVSYYHHHKNFNYKYFNLFISGQNK